MYSPHKDGVIRKLCRQDIIDQRTVPKIKVCPKQKVMYKLSKSQTIRKKLKHEKSKRWKLQKIDAANSNCIKIASWTKNNKKMANNGSFLNGSKQSIDYRFIDNNNNNNNNNNELLKKRYVEIGLSSISWTRHETDLLLTLCNDFDNRWSVIIDRYNCSKPPFRPKRNMIEIKQRYYECRALILSFQDKTNKTHKTTKYKYDGLREEKRRNEFAKLLMRTHDENIEISQTAQYYRKHNKLLRKKVNEMHKKRLQLRSYGAFICDRQQMTSTEKEENNNNMNNIHLSLPFGEYQGFGVVVHDDLLKKNGDNICNQNIYKQLPSNCIPKKYAKIRRNIQMIDDEYTKYKYELKLDEKNENATIIPFPYCDKSMIQNMNDNKNNKNNKNNTENEMDKEEQIKLLNSTNPNLGKDIAKFVQNELIKEKIITINKNNGMPVIEPMTNITRSMVNALREDLITYYALKTMINDKKKEMSV